MHIYPIPLEPQEIHSLWMQAASEEPISTVILTEAGNLGFGTGRGEIRSSKLFSFTCQCKTTPLRRFIGSCSHKHISIERGSWYKPPCQNSTISQQYEWSLQHRTIKSSVWMIPMCWLKVIVSTIVKCPSSLIRNNISNQLWKRFHLTKWIYQYLP